MSTNTWEKIKNPITGENGEFLIISNGEQHFSCIWSDDDKEEARVIGQWDFDQKQAQWFNQTSELHTKKEHDNEKK